MRAGLVKAAWVLLGLAVLLAIVRSTVADVYRVGSSSMRPTIFGGPDPRTGATFEERVLVRFGDAEGIERFDLVVVRRAGEAPIVKRVLGLPGETIAIPAGDLLVDGERLPLAAPRPAPIPVFDAATGAVEDYFQYRREEGGPWTRAGDEWRLDARAVPLGSDGGMLLFHKDLLDDYLDPEGRRVVGRREVNDARIECEVALDEIRGFLRFKLVEAGDTFEARLEAQPDGGVEAVILRYNARTMQDVLNLRERALVLAQQRVELAAGAWTRVAFENVDNHLILEVGDGRLTASYAGNEAHAGPTPEDRASLGPRVGLGGEECRARFRGIRVLRDLYVHPVGEYAVQRPLALGPDEYFVIGDNTTDSRDSRMFGPIRAEQIVGRPVLVVWPPGRFRVLAPAEPR